MAASELQATVATIAAIAPRRRDHVAHLLALLVLALVIYTPWARVPFPLVDYSEFLHLLGAGESFGDGLGRVVDYYHSHGRSSYLAYVQLALNWAFFGDRPAAWNLAVFTYTAISVASAWALLVRVGNQPLAATLAAALLIVATPAVPVWLRPTGEPLALLFLTLSIGIALSYRQATHWVGRLIIMLALMLGIALSKDLLAPLISFPLLLACCWDAGFKPPNLDKRTVALVAGAATVTAVSAFMIASALSQRVPDAYTEGYSLANLSLTHTVGIFWLIFLPYTGGFENTTFGAAHVIANGVFGALLIGGWVLVLKSNVRSHRIQELNGWLALVLAGVLLYAPLRWFSPLYAFPFFLGSVGLFARALSVLERDGRTSRWYARAGAIAVVLVCGATAFNTARRETADRRVHGRLSESLRRLPAAEGIVVLWPVVNRWEWAQQAAVIRRYAIDRGDLPANAPPAHDVPCGSLAPSEDRRRIIINYPEACGDLEFESTEITERYLTLAPLPELRTLRVQLAAPGAHGAEPESR